MNIAKECNKSIEQIQSILAFFHKNSYFSQDKRSIKNILSETICLTGNMPAIFSWRLDPPRQYSLKYLAGT